MTLNTKEEEDVETLQKNKKSIKRKEKEEKKHTTKQRSGFLKDGSVGRVGLMDGLGGDHRGHFRLQR